MTIIQRGDQVCGLLPDTPDVYLSVSQVGQHHLTVVIDNHYHKEELTKFRLTKQQGSIRYFTYCPERSVKQGVKRKWKVTIPYQTTETFVVFAESLGSAKNKAVGLMAKNYRLEIWAMAARLKNCGISVVEISQYNPLFGEHNVVAC